MKRIRFSLGVRLFLGFVAVSLIAVGICAFRVDGNVRTNARAQVEERLGYEVIMLGQMTANALFGPIDPADTSLATVVKQLADAVHTHLSVLAPDGTVVADSDATDMVGLPNQLGAPEVAAAIQSPTGAGVGVHAWSGEPRIFVAQTITRDGSLLGIARASVPLAAVDDVARGVRRQMLYGGVLAVLIALVLAAISALQILRPIKKVAEGAKKIGQGDLSHRVAVLSNDEIGDLATALNETSGQLQAMISRLDERNRDMRLVLDNVAQGLVTIDASGAIAEERSRAIDKWFGEPKAGDKIWDVFPDATPDARASLRMAVEQLFDGFLPVELTLDQMPRRLESGGQVFDLTYQPISGANDNVDKLLFVASDVTASVAAERAQADRRTQMCLFMNIAKDRAGVVDFLADTGALIDAVVESGGDESNVVAIRRSVHTIKGNCALFGLDQIARTCHEIETRMTETDATAVLDDDERERLRCEWADIVRRAQELLGHDNGGSVHVTATDIATLQDALRRGLDRPTLSQIVARWSLEPANNRLARLAEQARGLAERLARELVVEVRPSTVRLPTNGWGQFWSSLPHAVRNALDHGIEPAEERESRGKPRQGRFTFAAYEQGQRIVIELQDDGRGIDWEKLRQKATALGLPADSRADLVEALFTDGVSTRDTVTELSGRGVGLSALRSACKDLRGQVEIDSELHVGTTLRFIFESSHRLSLVPAKTA